jgi:hypothetical protein
LLKSGEGPHAIDTALACSFCVPPRYGVSLNGFETLRRFIELR